MSLEVALLEWSDEGRVRMVGRSGDPQLISLVRKRLVEQLVGDGEQPLLTLVREIEDASSEEENDT